jgi:hypothetical protein
VLGKLENPDNNVIPHKTTRLCVSLESKPSSVRRSAGGSKNKHEHARFEVLTAVLLKIQAFWDVTPRGLTALPWG